MAAHADWKLYMKVYNLEDIAEAGNTREENSHAKFSLLAKLKALGNVTCQACGGFGHKKSDCVTDDKLANIEPEGGPMRNLLRWAGEKVNTDAIQALRGAPVAHSNLARRRHNAPLEEGLVLPAGARRKRKKVERYGFQ